MAIDREQTLKQAEKLLRQGRLESAIAEYGRVAAEYPSDWATANLLGDLYVRAGRIADASQQYARVADHLSGAGFAAKAAALYKKVIKLDPGNERALLRSAELAAAQGLVADVRAYLNALFQHRLTRGDHEGARAVARTRVSFDPGDVVGHLDAARMLAEAGDAAGAAAELRTAGLALDVLGRTPEAVRALRESLRFDPADEDARGALIRLLLTQGDVPAALEQATTPGTLREFVALCDSRGLERLADLEPSDAATRIRLATHRLGTGDLDAAEQFLGGELDAGEPEVALILAEILLRRGHLDEARARIAAAIARDPDCAAVVDHLARRIAADAPDAGATAVAPLVDAALARGDAATARSQIRRFLADVPDSVTALRQLIEVCVEGGFTADLQDTQSRLVDALIRREAWEEALGVAEDLLASNPGDAGHASRLRRVLAGLGRDPAEILARVPGTTPDDDVGAADVLSDAGAGAEPHAGGGMSDDFSHLVEDLAAGRPAPAAEPGSRADEGERHASPALSARDAARPRPATRETGGPSRYPELSVVDEDLRRLFEDTGPPSEPDREEAAVEVDLSGALDEIRQAPETPVSATSALPAAPGAGRADAVGLIPEEKQALEGFFHQLHGEAVVVGRADEARRHYDEGREAYALGEPERALDLLRVAARAPAFRLEAARLIAGIAREQGNLAEAVEWLERAAEMPPPSAETGHALLDELATTLEAAGEEARALAVLLELRAVAPEYDDLDRRIAALSARQSGGGSPPPERPS